MSPLSPGQLPSWDADLPRIIRTLYNHQNSNSVSYSVIFLQTQQQCRGTDTKVPRCPSLPQRSREPQGIPRVCRARSSQARSAQGHHRRAARGEELSPREEGDQTDKDKKKSFYFKPRRCKGWKNCPSELSASYNRGWKAIFKNRRRE